MITFTNGNIFESDAHLVVIPVNCVGVPGAGLAKEWADKFPQYVNAYKQACTGGLRPGNIRVLNRVVDCDGKKYAPYDFVLFPTKLHWKNQTELSWIASGLQAYREWREHQAPYEWETAWPKIGCGLGGLNWGEVLPLMVHYLDHEKFEDIIYE